MKKNSILDHDSLLAFENLDIRSFSSENQNHLLQEL